MYKENNIIPNIPTVKERLRYFIFGTSIYPLYIFMILKMFVWGFTISILRQKFHADYEYLNFINTAAFGWIMMATSSIAAYFLLYPKHNPKNFWRVGLMFALFSLFFMSFITLAYLTNRPIDGAWARNGLEVIVILWIILRGANFTSLK
jgi:hypothetical protein